LATSSRIVVRETKKKEAGEVVTSRPRDLAHVLEAVGSVKALLRRGCPGFPDVVAADRDRVVARRMPGAPGEHVHDQAERRLRRVDPGMLRLVLLQDVVLHGASQLRRTHSLPLGGDHVEAEEDDGGR
jgi:hypothetical protein